MYNLRLEQDLLVRETEVKVAQIGTKHLQLPLHVFRTKFRHALRSNLTSR